MLDSVPTEVLALICRECNEKTVFRVLPRCCRSMRSSINSAAFLAHRAMWARQGVDWEQLRGVTLATTALVGRLTPFMPHVEPLRTYLMQTDAVDWSGGQERCPLTVDTRVLVAPGVKLFSDLPEEMRPAGGKLLSWEQLCFPGNDGNSFWYDAGPVPCPWMLQIFRAGTLSGKGYGVRTMVDIPEGAFVCLYWGEMVDGDRMEESHRRNHLYNMGNKPRSKYQLRVLFSVEDEFEDEDGHAQFVVDPTSRGNLARWINYSQDLSNLEPRIAPGSGGETRPEVHFYAKRAISAGEELLWNYCTNFPRRSAAPAKAGFLGGNLYKSGGWAALSTDHEMLRRPLPDGSEGTGSAATGGEDLRTVEGRWRSCATQPVAATWASQVPPPGYMVGFDGERAGPMGVAGKDKLQDVVLAQGYPPGPGASESVLKLHSEPEGARMQRIPPLPADKRWNEAGEIAATVTEMKPNGEMWIARESEYLGWAGPWWPMLPTAP